MDDRGTAGAPAAESGMVLVPDDRPRRLELPRLRRPAMWSLALGAASVISLSIAAFLPPDRLLITSGTPHSGWTINLAGVLYVAAGCQACVWLVRLQSLLARAGRLSSASTDAGLWVMWGIPILSWILPAVRISRWDKAIHGRRSWTTLSWAVLWGPFSARLYGTPPPRVAPDPTEAWWFVALVVATFALWSTTVVRLTRGAEVVAHETGVHA